jgi:hypothetical protein
LFGDAHGGDFGRDGSADATRDHQAGEDRAQLAAHGDANDCEGGGIHFDFVKLVVGLRAEDHPSECAGDEDDGLRFYSGEVDLVEQVAPGDFEGEKRSDGFLGKQSDAAEAFYPIGNPGCTSGNHAGGKLAEGEKLG